MKSEIYSCDECGKQKQESNHWWVLILNGLQNCSQRRSFVLVEWMPGYGLAVAQIEKHLCSESCASIALSKWMSAQRAETPVQYETEKTQ